MPFCTNCGCELKETDRFCGKCGFPVEELKPSRTTAQPQREKVTMTPSAGLPASNRDEVLVTLSDTRISEGGIIEGKASLNLVKPEKKGMRVLLEIVGEHRWVEWDQGAGENAGMERDSHFQRIYEYREVLEGEKEYLAGTHDYEFQVKIPSDIEAWRFKRESFFMKKLGLKPQQYLDQSKHDAGKLTWYMVVRFDKRRIGLSTHKIIPLTYVD